MFNEESAMCGVEETGKTGEDYLIPAAMHQYVGGLGPIK